jgi:uncharacterized protein (DUF1919 family)
LPYRNKLCLTDEDLPGIKSAVTMKRYSTDGKFSFYLSLVDFDLVAWLNGELATGDSFQSVAVVDEPR